MNKDKKEIIDNLNNSYGFMLSYGDSYDVIPMGVYKVDSILPSYKNPYKYGAAYRYGITSYPLRDRYSTVKLVKVNSDNEIKENSVIYIPFLEFKKLTNLETEENNYFARQLFNLENKDDQLLYITKIAQEYYKKHKLSPIEFWQSVSLDNLNATYEVNGNLMGNNFTLIPFSYGKVKKKVLTMTKQYVDDLPSLNLCTFYDENGSNTKKLSK